MAAFPLWAAIRTIKSKIGTWVGYDRYTELDPSVSRTQWAAAIGQARAALTNRVLEITRPLNRRPAPGEITPYTSRTARGFMQYVDIYVRDAQTGLVESRPWAIKSMSLRSRQAVITEALARFEAAALPEGTFEGEEVVGASYSGTVEMIPGI